MDEALAASPFGQPTLRLPERWFSFFADRFARKKFPMLINYYLDMGLLQRRG